MKILNWTEFAAMPEGTVFSFWEPCIAEGLHQKGETWLHDGKPGDFWYSDLIASPAPDKDGWATPDGPLEVSDAESRWGMFEYDQLFAVYERADVQHIIERLAYFIGSSTPAVSGGGTV